jgi:hypothetical protein
MSATNRWLTTILHLGNLFEVRREVAAWIRNPEPSLFKKLQITPNPKTCPRFDPLRSSPSVFGAVLPLGGCRKGGPTAS